MSAVHVCPGPAAGEPSRGLRLRRHEDVHRFLEHAGDWLVTREVEHTLILGVVERLRRGAPEFEPPFYLVTLEEGGRIVGCAVRTPPYGVALTRMPPPAIPLLLADLGGVYPRLPRVNGPPAEARALAEGWAALHETRVTVGMRQYVHELRTVVPPARPVPGHLRPAAGEDAKLLTAWFDAFAREAGVLAVSARARILERITVGELDVWDHDGAVCMVGVAARSPNGARVGPVYTPPEHRGKGYATGAVAAFSQRLLDGGGSFCCLYTDAENPTSNAIYGRVGYRPVAEAVELRFLEPPG